MWEDDANERLFEPEEYLAPLINLLYKRDMLLALPKGIPTLQTAAGNWTRPNNVWRCNTPEDPIQRCDTVPAIRPPLADHLPIITILDLPMPRLSTPPTLNFRMADWNRVSSALGPRLEVESPAVRITSKEEFLKKVDDVVRIVDEVLHELIDEKSPNPYKQCWWTEELSRLKKAQNSLSNKSHRFRHVRDHPTHTEYKAAANKFKEVMSETRSQDWVDWLEGASQQDLYLANKYISSEPSDYSNACIPALHIHTNGMPDLAEDNEQKVKVLASSFFPSPPNTSSVPPHQEYPTSLKGPRYFSRDRIRQVIRTLSPFKAPGPDKIPNVVLMKCTDALFELTVYHPRWLESIMLILRKIGKTSYDVAKSYRPIGLIDTIPKVLSTLCSKHISYLAEKHNLLPSTQFGGCPGRNTTDAMLLMVHKIKDAWRRGKVATALFLGFRTGIPWVGFSHTVPVPAHTVTCCG